MALKIDPAAARSRYIHVTAGTIPGILAGLLLISLLEEPQAIFHRQDSADFFVIQNHHRPFTISFQI